MIELGAPAPDFPVLDTTYFNWLGDSWGVLFSYPKAFTGICSTELVEASRLLEDFAALDVKIAAVSTDSHESQAKFGEQLSSEHQCPADRLPQFADPDKTISALYGFVHPQMSADMAMRVLYAIDSDRKVRLALAFPPKVARDFSAVLEAVRILRAESAS